MGHLDIQEYQAGLKLMYLLRSQAGIIAYPEHVLARWKEVISVRILIRYFYPIRIHTA